MLANRSTPAPPLKIAEVRFSAAMHPRTEIDQSPWCSDERGQQIRSQHVDGKNMLEPVDGLSPRFAVANPRVVDHGIEWSYRMRLLGDGVDLRDTREVTDKH